MTVSADFLKTDTAYVYKISSLTDAEDPWLQGTDEDKHIVWYTWTNGYLKMIDGYSAIMCDPVGLSMFEANFYDEEYCTPAENHWLRLRARSYKDYGFDLTCTHWLAGNIASYNFVFPCNGEWQDIIIDLNAQPNFPWADYIAEWDEYKDAVTEERPFPNLDGKPLQRSLRIDFDGAKEDEVPILIDYVGFFTSEEAARAFDGNFDVTAATEEATEAVTEEATEAATEEVVDDTTTAPQTADIALVLAAIGLTSGALVLKNKKNRK